MWTTRRATRESYPQGWAQGPMRDSTLEFRLSIVKVKILLTIKNIFKPLNNRQAEEGDTGEYTCTTPFKQSHSIRIVVAAVSCPPVLHTRGLVTSTNSSILNTRWAVARSPL